MQTLTRSTKYQPAKTSEDERSRKAPDVFHTTLHAVARIASTEAFLRSSQSGGEDGKFLDSFYSDGSFMPSRIPLTTAGTPNVADSLPETYLMSGMPASTFGDGGTKRDGIWSLYDSARYQSNARALESAPSAMTFIPLDPNGNPFPAGSVYKHNGRLHRVNGGGVVRLVDVAQHRRNQQMREMLDARISEVAELCMSSDKDCREVLGLSAKDYEELFSPQAVRATRPNVMAFKKAWDIPDDILAADCRIRTMMLRPRESAAYVEGLAKLRAIVLNMMPILDDSHISASALKELGEDAYAPGEVGGAAKSA